MNHDELKAWLRDPQGPGPSERRWINRMRFKLTGHWGPEVVAERLMACDMQMARDRVKTMGLAGYMPPR